MPERKSDQPHSIYTYSLDPVISIQEKLGIIEGMRDFSHPFKFAQNVYDLLRTVERNIDVGILKVKGESKEKENPISLNKKAYDEFKQIWSGLVYLHITLSEKTARVIKEKIVLKLPDTQTELDEYYPIPSLKKLVPTEDKEQNNLLIRIGSDIPEKYAYEKTDIISLDSIGGCHDLMPKTYQCSVCGRLGHEAWYSSQEELDASIQLSGGYVTKSYYNKIKDMLFEALDDRWFELKSNIIEMAILVKESSYEKHERVRLKK